MALASITEALTQYNANLNWQDSTASARLALEAIRYLMVNRGKLLQDEGSRVDFDSLAGESAKLEKFLGATAPRANGRRRTVGAVFPATPGVQ